MRPLLLSTLLILALACTKSKKHESVPPSVQALIDSFKCGENGCNASVSEYHMKNNLWKGATIYVFLVGGPACDGFPLFFDAEGNKLELPKDYQFAANFQNDAELIKTTWKCQ
jgi:hypothetical protein